jgi:hypothetical protein
VDSNFIEAIGYCGALASWRLVEVLRTGAAASGEGPQSTPPRASYVKRSAKT